MSSDPAYSAQSPAVGRRNVLLLGFDIAMFMTAIGLLGPTTLVPLFVSKLTDNPLAIGMLSAAFQLGWFPQLFAAGYVERSARKLPAVIGYTVVERIPALGLALCALAAAGGLDGGPLVAAPIIIAAVYLSRFVQSIAAGLALTPWLDLVARAVPAERRGSFMGNWTMVGNVLGIGTAALAAPLLEWLPFPYGFAACFGLAFVVLMFGLVPLFLVVEPPGPPPRPPRPFVHHLGELTAVLAGDAPFRRFLIGLSLAGLGTMATGFLVVYAVQRLGASDELAAWYTVALLAAQVFANVALGRLADRRGFVAVGKATALSSAGMAAFALVAPGPLWLIASFALIGIGQAGTMLAKLTGPMDFAPPDRRPTYIALCGALVSLAAAVGPLIGGPIVAWAGYEALFGVGAACSLAAVFALGPVNGRPRPAG